MKKPSHGKGNGRAHAWILAHVNYEGDWCLIWPFSKPNGYGMFTHLGERYYAHRRMCELVKGPPPTPDHEAGHSCGRGHEGCIHPKHLDWKTKSENQADRATQGTKATGGYGKLTPEKAQAIRALKGTVPQRKVAELYGVSRANVSLIQNGKSWTGPNKYWPENVTAAAD